jgi:hypothetical protein
MDMSLPSTSPLKATNLVFVLWNFPLSLASLTMTMRDEISTEWTIVENELVPPYYPGNERSYGKTQGLLPEYAIFSNVFCNTLTPKRGEHTSIQGSTKTLVLAILDGKPTPYISTFLWTEFMFILNHGTIYVIYALYIQRIINLKTEMEFGFDGKHGAYQPHIVRGLAIPPPPLATAVVGTLAAAPASPAHAPSPPAVSRRAPSVAHESSRDATRRGKKQNILVKGLKTLISMCHSIDALIRESHQQMSQRLSTLEERQHEMCTNMGFETHKPFAYPPLPPPAMEDPWAWYRNVDGDDNDDEIDKESE